MGSGVNPFDMGDGDRDYLKSICCARLKRLNGNLSNSRMLSDGGNIYLTNHALLYWGIVDPITRKGGLCV